MKESNYIQNTCTHTQKSIRTDTEIEKKIGEI